MGSDSGLALRSIEKAFGATAVLRGIDLDVARGQSLSLLGPSGSGKSTLLRIVAGLAAPDSGTVHLGAHDVTTVPVHRRHVGLVFQDQALFPHLDVDANVAYGIRRRADARSRVRDLLDLVGLAGFGGRDVATLSGGEAQRVAIARALAPSPSVLLLDEPFAGLDQAIRERLLLDVRGLLRELGVTAVVVTHDPTEAAILGDQLAVLDAGRIAQLGDPGAVLDRPASDLVARLVGHRNLVDARVRSGVVETPWGAFRTDDDVGVEDATALVPVDAISTGTGGGLAGVVAGLIFRGGSAFAVVDGDWPQLEVRADPRWRVGDRVELAIDADAVRVLRRRQT